MDISKDKLLEMYRSMQRIRHFETKTRDLATGQRDSRLRPRLDRRRSFRHRRLRGAAQDRSHHLNPSRPRPSDRQGRTPRPHDGGDLRQAHRLLQGQGRLDAYRRLLARHPRRQRDRRRLACRSRPARRWRAVIAGKDDVTACFFGDGASNEGTFHESLNLAAVWKLPVVFVCENNGFGEFTPMQTVTSVKDIARARAGLQHPGLHRRRQRCDRSLSLQRAKRSRARAQAKVPRCSNAKPIDGRGTSSASRRSSARARIVRRRSRGMEAQVPA